jgi:hypothetical protein
MYAAGCTKVSGMYFGKGPWGLGISWERGISRNTASGDKKYRTTIRKKRESSMGFL